MKYFFFFFTALCIALSAFFTTSAVSNATVIDKSQNRVSGLSGTYYDTTGEPLTRDERNNDIVAMRIDPVISFQWDARTPPPVASDFFTAEWKGALQAPATGTYAFAVISDGAAALWLNDSLVIEGMPSELTRRSANMYEYAYTKGVFFEVGRAYHIRVKTRHNRNNGLANLWWRAPNGVWEIIPSEYFSSDAPSTFLPAGRGSGASATITQYIDDKTERGARTVPVVQIDFPPEFQRKGTLRFDVSWSGEIEPRVSTFYRFYTSADGSMEFSLQGEDDIARIATSTEGAQDARSESVFLLARKRYQFTAAYRNEDSVARARLMWSNARGTEKELIPRSQLYAPLRAQKQPKEQGTGLSGLYYNDEQFDSLVFTRIDPTISFNWKKGSPKSGIVNADNFSVRWEGEIEAQTTDFYQFSSTVDDKIRITIDGNVVLDTSRIRAGKTHHSFPLLLESGRRYPVTVEYVDYIGNASVNFLWSSSDGKRSIVPRDALYPAPIPPLRASRGMGTGLFAEYFSDKRLSQGAFTKIDPAVAFDWQFNPPDASMPKDGFSVRWTGWILAPENDDYTFTIKSDDGVRFWLGEKNQKTILTGTSALIDQWHDTPRTSEYQAKKTLERGHRYPVKIEYYEQTETAWIQLLWARENAESVFIPRSQLYPAPGRVTFVTRPPEPEGYGTGLRGRYYKGIDVTNMASLPHPTVERIDPVINFSWGYAVPHELVPQNNYSVRWEGFIQPRYDGDYLFSLRADERARLFINELPITATTKPLITTDPNRPLGENASLTRLEKGRLYPIRIDYSEDIGEAGISFLWSHAQLQKEIVPQSQLYPPSVSVLAPLGIK